MPGWTVEGRRSRTGDGQDSWRPRLGGRPRHPATLHLWQAKGWAPGPWVGDGRRPAPRGAAKASRRPAPRAGQGMPTWRPCSSGTGAGQALQPVGGMAPLAAGFGGAVALAGGRWGGAGRGMRSGTGRGSGGAALCHQARSREGGTGGLERIRLCREPCWSSAKGRTVISYLFFMLK